MGSGKSKLKTITLPQDLLQQLRCSSCKQHLSCAPIRLLPDGASVCGRCTPSDHNAPVYRELALEAALSRTKFPCKYNPYGCPEKILFGHTIDHEAKCAYYPFPCPSLPCTTCTWQGSVVQVRDHFLKNHPFLVIPSARFNLEVSRDKEEVLLVVNDGSTFLIKYRYDSGTTGLRYDIRHFSSVAAVGTYKICLINSTKPANNVNLEGNRCLLYSPNNLELQDTPVLTVSKFLEVLGNPVEFTIEFDLPAVKPSHKSPKSREFINYDLLESLRCPDCQNHLSLPIFDGPSGLVCSDCTHNYPPSKNTELQRVITATSYPCRWNHCRFIGQGHSIRLHEHICPFQPQKCPAMNCSESLVVAQRNMLEFHMLLHGYLYFCKRNVYKSAFRFSEDRNIVTTGKNNEVIAIRHQIVCSNGCVKHVFALSSCKASFTEVIAHVYFQHSHCKLKSRRFYLDCAKLLTVTADLLPKCFREHKKMSVVVEL